jgi:hypothetical protein
LGLVVFFDTVDLSEIPLRPGSTEYRSADGLTCRTRATMGRYFPFECVALDVYTWRFFHFFLFFPLSLSLSLSLSIQSRSPFLFLIFTYEGQMRAFNLGCPRLLLLLLLFLNTEAKEFVHIATEEFNRKTIVTKERIVPKTATHPRKNEYGSHK